MCDLETVGSSSMLRFIHRAATFSGEDVADFRFSERGVECHAKVVEVILNCLLKLNS